MQKRKFIFSIIAFLSVTVWAQESLPLDTVLFRSMAAASKYNNLVESYEADIYMRSYIETKKKNFLYKYTHHIPRFVLHDPKSDEALIETLSSMRFEWPNNYVQNIKNITGTLTSMKDVALIPFHFLNINIYGETTNEESYFMPTRNTTSKYYRYRLVKESEEDGIHYYTISYKPRYENSKLLEGSYVVEKGTWRIVHFTGEGVDSFNKFSFDITMGDTWLTRFLPVDLTIYHTAGYLGNVVASRHLARIDYESTAMRSSNEKPRNLNISDYFEVKLDSVPVTNDSLFWSTERLIPLQAKEKDVLKTYNEKQLKKKVLIVEKDGNIKNDKAAQKLAQNIIMNSRYKLQSTSIGYSGLLNPFMLGYSSKDGVIYRQKLNFDFSLSRSRSFNINAFAAYLFRHHELITDITSTWNYEPYHQGRLGLSMGVGNPAYSSLFIDNIKNDFNKGDSIINELNLKYYKDYYIKLYNDYEVFNGFMATIGAEYHLRKPTQNTLTTFRSNFRSNSEEAEIEKLLVNKMTFAPYIRLSWTPEQYYRYERGRKIYVRSRYPTIKFEYSKAITDILQGSSQYEKLELDISQNIRFGLMNSIQYHIGAGRFIRQKTEYFADFTFFAKNYFPDNWQDGTGGSFNLLNREFFNSTESYIQGHLMIESPFLIFRNIPLLSDFINRERIYVSQLYTPQIKSYTEIGYGIGNRFFRTANVGIFCSFMQHKFNEFGVKASFEL